jgi:hypothetical protein
MGYLVMTVLGHAPTYMIDAGPEPSAEGSVARPALTVRCAKITVRAASEVAIPT